MNVEYNRFSHKITLKSSPFYGGIDIYHIKMKRLEEYFIEKGFKVVNTTEQTMTVSKGSNFTNIFAMNMNKLKRKITIFLNSNDQLEILSVVDTTSQVMRQSEIDFFVLEVEDIISYIQRNESSNLSANQNSITRSGNYLILFLMTILLGICLFLFYFLYNYLVNL